MLLWNAYGYMFIASLYQHLFPASHAIKKPKLVRIETIFTYLTLSYPSWKRALKAGLDSRDTMPIIRSFMVQLRDLMEVFIPMVIFLLRNG